MKFSLPHGPMLTNTKKKIVKIKKSKILKNRKKKGLEIWRIATFPLNLAVIRLMVSEKHRVLRTTTDNSGRQESGARDTALALLTQSSRAKMHIDLMKPFQHVVAGTFSM